MSMLVLEEENDITASRIYKSAEAVIPVKAGFEVFAEVRSKCKAWVLG